LRGVVVGFQWHDVEPKSCTYQHVFSQETFKCVQKWVSETLIKIHKKN